MDYKTIEFRQEPDGLAVLTLNRPAKLNAFSPTMGWEVVDAVMRVIKDDAARVLVIHGAGTSFCAGGDLDSDLSQSVVERKKWRASYDWKLLNTLPIMLRQMAQPVVVAMHGWAIGVGVSLPLCCDIRFAAESCKLSLRFVRLGNTPEMGSTYNLPRIVGIGKALELAITGDTIDAKEALRIGLVNRVYPDAELLPATLEFARGLATGPSVAIELIKRGMYQGLNGDLNSSVQYECFASETVRETEDMAEGVKAIMEKRKPKFKGR